jgi:hypothetical protein
VDGASDNTIYLTLQNDAKKLQTSTRRAAFEPIYPLSPDIVTIKSKRLLWAASFSKSDFTCFNILPKINQGIRSTDETSQIN